jgi:hypothetical protein
MRERRREFAIRVDTIGQLFWPLDARPTADRALTDDVRWALLDEWERVRDESPSTLRIYAPADERDTTDEVAVGSAVRTSLHKASGRLRNVDPLSRQDSVAAWIGVGFLFLSLILSTLLEQASEDVLVQGISQAVVVIGWVAVWAPASRFIVDVVPHIFNRRRYAEFADVAVEFVWV